MTATDVRLTTSATATARRPVPPVGLAVTAAAAIAAVLAATVLPGLPAGEPGQSMTHYMGLLATSQPWHLVFFMAIPVILAETVAITELVILFSRSANRAVHAVSRWAGLVGGVYFLGVFAYLLRHAVIPLTQNGLWHGPADVLAVGFYLIGVIPLFGMALLELGVIGGTLDETGRRKLHATFVGIFLVVAHVAMILGMLDPTLLWSPAHIMPGGGSMPGMHM